MLPKVLVPHTQPQLLLGHFRYLFCCYLQLGNLLGIELYVAHDSESGYTKEALPWVSDWDLLRPLDSWKWWRASDGDAEQASQYERVPSYKAISVTMGIQVS